MFQIYLFHSGYQFGKNSCQRYHKHRLQIDFEKQLLHLKAYSGTPTEHTTIPFGKGICGQVALSNKPFLVPDVTQQENYIACSATVRSELVVPLFVEGKNIGQIDIDSETPDAFSVEDELFLASICELVAQTYGKLLIQL